MILHACKNTGTWWIIYVLGTAEYMVFLMQYFFLSLEIYFLADHIIYGILDSLKTELQFTVYNTAVCICVMFF